MAKTSRREIFEPGPLSSTLRRVAEASSAGRAQKATIPRGASARWRASVYSAATPRSRRASSKNSERGAPRGRKRRPPGRAAHGAPHGGGGRGAEREEGAEDEGAVSDQLAVSRVRRGVGREPLPGEPCRLRRRELGEKLLKFPEGFDPPPGRPMRGVLERVGDPEQKVGDHHLPSRRLRENRDRERERAARLLQKNFEVSHQTPSRGKA